LQRADNTTTSLIAYFKANADNIIGLGGKPARDTFYMEFPEYFTFNSKLKKWKLYQKDFSID
jgi:hypothetical protein